MTTQENTRKRLDRALAESYEIERELGRGGMATVYLAEDRTHRRKVAIKVLSPEVAHAVGSQRFLNEIEIAAKLHHPNILQLHESGEADGILYYVMPYVEGESLRDRLAREKQLPLEVAVEVVREVADALSFAHDHHVVHRDIKPENILFTAGHAIVADFGIAKALGAAAGDRLTQTGISVGTPTYMSPEQAAATEALDARSDLYSLACVTYEILGGEPPFNGPTPQAVLARHAMDPVPELRTIRPNVPEGVAKTIEKALAKVPADRFPTVRAFASALEKASTGEASAAEVARRGEAARLRRIGLLAAAVVLVVLGIWAVTTFLGPMYERIAVLPPTNLLNDPGQDHLALGVHDALIGELQKAGISVKARTSMLRYRDGDTPIRDIAAELHVDGLIEPTFRWDADSVRIEVRLVSGATEEYVGNPVESRGAVQDVIGVYHDLVRQVADELRIDLSPEAEARLARSTPVNPEAYQDYLRGQVEWATFTPAGMENALAYFRQALERDPDFPQAYAGIALVWVGQQQFGFSAPLEAGPPARQALARALAIDSTLVEVRYAAAMVRLAVEWDWEAAEETFRRAISLNPRFPDAHGYYAHLLMMRERWDESYEQMEEAMEIDPFNLLLVGLHGMTRLFRGRVDEAIAVFEDALQAHPGYPLAHSALQLAYQLKGMEEESLEHTLALWAIPAFPLPPDFAEAVLRAYEEQGYAEANLLMAETLVAVSRQVFVPPCDIALFFDLAQEADKALGWLERGVDARDPGLLYLNVMPYSETLRTDPRFIELQRRMGLPVS